MNEVVEGIQAQVEKELERAIKYREESKNYIDTVKLIKAEFQRGKNKILSDTECVTILVYLMNNVEDNIEFLRKKYNTISNDEIDILNEQFLCIIKFIPADIFNILCYSHDNWEKWIKENIDMSKVKHKMQIIKIIKEKYPFVDGNFLKELIEKMTI